MDQKQIVKTGEFRWWLWGAILLFFMVGRLVGWRGKAGGCRNRWELAATPTAAAAVVAASEPGAGGGGGAGLVTIVPAETGNQVAERLRADEG